MLKFLTVHYSLFLSPVIYVLSLTSQYSPKRRVLRRFESRFIFRFAHVKEQVIQRNMVEFRITFFWDIMVWQCIIYTDVVIKLLASNVRPQMSKNMTFRPFKLRPARDLETLGSSSQRLTPVLGVRNVGYIWAKNWKLLWLILERSLWMMNVVNT
jgi:hypothetical protein